MSSDKSEHADILALPPGQLNKSKEGIQASPLTFIAVHVPPIVYDLETTLLTCNLAVVSEISHC